MEDRSYEWKAERQILRCCYQSTILRTLKIKWPRLWSNSQYSHANHWRHFGTSTSKHSSISRKLPIRTNGNFPFWNWKITSSNWTDIISLEFSRPNNEWTYLKTNRFRKEPFDHKKSTWSNLTNSSWTKQLPWQNWKKYSRHPLLIRRTTRFIKTRPVFLSKITSGLNWMLKRLRRSYEFYATRNVK